MTASSDGTDLWTDLHRRMSIRIAGRVCDARARKKYPSLEEGAEAPVCRKDQTFLLCMRTTTATNTRTIAAMPMYSIAFDGASSEPSGSSGVGTG